MLSKQKIQHTFYKIYSLFAPIWEAFIFRNAVSKCLKDIVSLAFFSSWLNFICNSHNMCSIPSLQWLTLCGTFPGCYCEAESKQINNFEKEHQGGYHCHSKQSWALLSLRTTKFYSRCKLLCECTLLQTRCHCVHIHKSLNLFFLSCLLGSKVSPLVKS